MSGAAYHIEIDVADYGPNGLGRRERGPVLEVLVFRWEHEAGMYENRQRKLGRSCRLLARTIKADGLAIRVWVLVVRERVRR